jgi:hypothetical protein
VAVALMLAVHLARAIPLLRVTNSVAFDAEPLMSTFTAIPPGALIGVFTAGVVPYYLPEQRFHDFLGKSDRRIARSPAKPGPPGHNKWDYGTRWERFGRTFSSRHRLAEPMSSIESSSPPGRTMVSILPCGSMSDSVATTGDSRGRRETSFGSTRAGNQHVSPR